MAKRTVRAAKRAEKKVARVAAQAAEAAAPSPLGDRPIRVQAIEVGYYDHIRRRVGDVFTIANGKAFSSKWMQRVDKGTPEKVTTGQQDINRQHDELLNQKLSEKATGAGNPLGAKD